MMTKTTPVVIMLIVILVAVIAVAIGIARARTNDRPVAPFVTGMPAATGYRPPPNLYELCRSGTPSDRSSADEPGRLTGGGLSIAVGDGWHPSDAVFWLGFGYDVALETPTADSGGALAPPLHGVGAVPVAATGTRLGFGTDPGQVAATLAECVLDVVADQVGSVDTVVDVGVTLADRPGWRRTLSAGAIMVDVVVIDTGRPGQPRWGFFVGAATDPAGRDRLYRSVATLRVQT